MASIGSLPKIRYNRSVQDLSYSYKTAFNEGDLIPVYVQEVFPGDNHKVNSSFVIRTTSPFIRPIMDNIFLDMHYFFVPNRLVFDKWKDFMGENSDSYWTQNEVITVPQTYGDGASGNVPIGSLADYFGINNGTIDDDKLSVNLLPFRAFALIYNEWYRDQNLQEPVYIYKDSFAGSEVINNLPFAPNNYTGLPPKANKLRDYFTSALPEPQKGEAVSIPISGVLPVGPLSYNLDIHQNGFFTQTNGLVNTLKFKNQSDNLLETGVGPIGLSSGSLAYGPGQSFTPAHNVYPTNLGAIATNQLDGTINDLRFAVQLQKFLEKDARYGTRYIEYLYGHWGITSSDRTLQRPQYLGGKRSILNLTQVTQTSQSSENSPLGQVSAYSLSNGSLGFNAAFEEHGFIIGIACVRHHHSYQQGNPKFFTDRVNKLDYYDPLFANLGEQPIYTKELYSDTAYIDGSEVFGYNEAFADLRSRNSIITGSLKSSANNGLDVWHMADEYSSRPYLNGEWIKESGEFLDRCLSVPSSQIPNFICDFYHHNKSIRVMPAYSIPGLMDHH